jgi:glycosyltransferase involved in cell wall biosynthesis
MDNKIGIVITTFLRDELLEKSIKSLELITSQLSIYPNWEIIIVDQNPTESKLNHYQGPHHYISVPYNCGLSVARNLGIEYAKNLECNYVLIGSDSFLFNESLNWIDCLCKELGTFKLTKEHNFDLIGFELSGCACGWEAKLNLISNEGFELDFIDKENSSDFYSHFHPFHCRIYRCDILRNFFLATTESLINVKWDENLLLGEHEDFFYRYKQYGYKVGWTDLITVEKMKDRPDEYAEFRRKNFNEGIIKLKEKYKINQWVIYKNLENSKKD